MPRYRLTLEYDGGPFVGWQRQENGLSVQEALECAIHAFSGETVSLHGAGRTDAGVHALGQVAHFDLERPWMPDRIRDAVNAHVRPRPIAVLGVAEVEAGFDARFSAVRRHYLYRILNRRAPTAIDAGRAWWVRAPLEAATMHEAAQTLVGRHDFTTFRAAQCQAASPVKTLDRLDVLREGEAVSVRATARSFLHSQVRSMVGSLVRVGEGKWPPEQIAAALDARDRAACGPLAPPWGLYLVAIDY